MYRKIFIILTFASDVHVAFLLTHFYYLDSFLNRLMSINYYFAGLILHTPMACIVDRFLPPNLV